MGVEVRGPGQEELVEGDRVAGVDKPVILRWGQFVTCQLLCQSKVIFGQFEVLLVTIT